jgi:hypothetical protein
LHQLSEAAEEARLLADVKDVSNMNPTSTVSGTESKSEGQLDHTAAVQSPESPIPAPEAAKPGSAQENPRVESGPKASNQSVEDEWPRGQPPSEKEKGELKKRTQKPSWLMDDPQGWVGRRVKSRKNLAVYIVNQIYKNGRVNLERNWMTYFTDVETVRKDYDTYC